MTVQDLPIMVAQLTALSAANHILVETIAKLFPKLSPKYFDLLTIFSGIALIVLSYISGVTLIQPTTSPTSDFARVILFGLIVAGGTAAVNRIFDYLESLKNRRSSK